MLASSFWALDGAQAQSENPPIPGFDAQGSNPKASDPEPRFQIPWQNWQKRGGNMLSAGRGVRKHENVAVLVVVPASVFR